MIGVMTMINIPRCPICNMKPEFVWRGNSPSVRFGAIKCPNNHFRAQTAYHNGSKAAAEAALIVAWKKEISEVKK